MYLPLGWMQSLSFSPLWQALHQSDLASMKLEFYAAWGFDLQIVSVMINEMTNRDDFNTPI
jgi:hypothetical protein